MEHSQQHAMGRGIATIAAAVVGLALVVPIAQWSATGHAFRPTPEASVMEGSIATLDVVSRTPRMGVHVGEGQVVDLGLDPRDTMILYGGQPATLDQLAVGRHVKTYYVTRGGKTVATSVVVTPPVVSFPPPRPAEGPAPGQTPTEKTS
ncbi:MAG: hypothetical protein HY600_04735 [Candidatus Omnitrophica bacterium]|nr:hypothetical protein [Candidatus Omnitrophota bacterium]